MYLAYSAFSAYFLESDYSESEYLGDLCKYPNACHINNIWNTAKCIYQLYPNLNLTNFTPLYKSDNDTIVYRNHKTKMTESVNLLNANIDKGVLNRGDKFDLKGTKIIRSDNRFMQYVNRVKYLQKELDNANEHRNLLEIENDKIDTDKIATLKKLEEVIKIILTDHDHDHDKVMEDIRIVEKEITELDIRSKEITKRVLEHSENVNNLSREIGNILKQLNPI